MFELVERQPSHFSNPDVLNLTPGEAVQGGRAKGSLSLWFSGNCMENCTLTSGVFPFALIVGLELLGQFNSLVFNQWFRFPWYLGVIFRRSLNGDWIKKGSGYYNNMNL